MFKLNQNILLSKAANTRVLVDSFVHFERTHLYNDTIFVQSNPLDANGSDVYWCYEHPLMNLAMEDPLIVAQMEHVQHGDAQRDPVTIRHIAYVVVPDGLWSSYRDVPAYPEDPAYFVTLNDSIRKDVRRILAEYDHATVVVTCSGFELLDLPSWLMLDPNPRIAVTRENPFDVLKRADLVVTNKMSALVFDTLRIGISLRCFHETDPIWERMTEHPSSMRTMHDLLASVFSERRCVDTPSYRSVLESASVLRINRARVDVSTWNFRGPVRDVFVFDDAAQLRFVTNAVRYKLPWPRTAHLTNHTLLITLCKENDIHRRLTRKGAKGWIAIDACPLDSEHHISVRSGADYPETFVCNDTPFDPICSKIGFPSVPPYRGKVFLVMDNPLGMHWSSPQRHKEHWTTIRCILETSGFETVALAHPNHDKVQWSHTYMNTRALSTVRPLDRAIHQYPDIEICVCGRGSSMVRCIHRGLVVVDGINVDQVKNFVIDPDIFMQQNTQAILENLTECVISKHELSEKILALADSL